MTDPDDIVNKIYGKSLVRRQTGNINHLYTRYQHKQTKEQYYLKAIDLPSTLYISDGITEIVSQKYHKIITPIKIILLERTFQSCSYLIRAPENIILLTTFMQVKRQYKEKIQIDFFLRFLQFLVYSYKILEYNQLPVFSMSQLGINDKEQFTLCDPSLYFKSQQENIILPVFGTWILGILREFLDLPLNPEEYQQFCFKKSKANLVAIKPLMSLLLTEKATPEIVLLKLESNQNRCSEDITTITSSYADPNEVFDKKNIQSIHKQKSTFNKIGKLGKMVILFVIVGLIVTASVFVFQFFNRKIICEEGQFLSSINQCLSCSDGCLRCQDSGPKSCMKCSVNMYLVLDEQDDKQGNCLKECRGKLINLNVCVRDRVSLKGLPKPRLNFNLLIG